MDKPGMDYGRCWIQIIALLTLALDVKANMTMGDFLQQARNDARQRWSSAASSQPHNVNPWTENAEIRLSGDNNSDNKQALSLRFKPKGFGQGSAENAILDLHRQQRGMTFETAFNAALKARYDQLLGLFSEQALVQKLEQRLALTESEQALQRNLAYTDDFRPDALLQTELRAEQLREQTLIHRKRLQDLHDQLRISHLTESFLTIDDMLAVATTTPELPTGGKLLAAELDVKMAQQQRRLDRARQGIALSLLEVQYERADRKDDALGVTLGIRIPIGNSYINAKRAYGVAEAMDNLQQQQQIQQRDAATQGDMLKWQKTEASAIKATLDSIDRRIQLALRSGRATLLLTLQRQQLAEKQKLTDIHHRALRHFIDYLGITGQLVQVPLRNWLLPGQPDL